MSCISCKEAIFAAIEPLEARTLLAYVPPASGRSEIDFNASWKFLKQEKPKAETNSVNDARWPVVNLPHTWNAFDAQDGGSNNYYQGTGWYRKRYTPSANLKGKQFFLKFDAAMISTEVYVNGTLAGTHKGGYSAFSFDLNPYLKVGKANLIAVKVNNSNDPNIAPYFQKFAPDWPKWGGLYRDVSIVVTDPIQINPLNHGAAGVYLTQTKVSSASANLRITAELRNSMLGSNTANVKVVITDAKGNAVKTLDSRPSLVKGKSTKYVIFDTTLDKPHLWNGVLDPYLYTVYTQVSDAAGASDIVTQPLGLRSYKADPQKGFLLNGKSYPLRGVSYYTDRLNKGSAVSTADRAQDIALIREIGANTVRMAHFQHFEDEYDAWDKAGIVVWNEIPLDANFNASADFANNLKQQLTETIRQTFNHPSVVFLCIGNEIPGTQEGYDLISSLQKVAKKENPALITTIASNIFFDDQVIKFDTDVPAFNKYYGWYTKELKDFKPWLDAVHKKYPDVPIGISEYGAGGSIFHHEANPPKPLDTGTNYHPEEYENLTHEVHWAALATRPWVYGSWAWEMFDSASDWRNQGDTAGRVDKGLVTFDRKTKKDSFFFYKANWTNTPVMYISSRRFTDRPSALNDIKVYSNCDSVTFKVNGQTIATLNPGSTKIAKWTGVTLQQGANVVTVSGKKNGVTYTDTVTWNVA